MIWSSLYITRFFSNCSFPIFRRVARVCSVRLNTLLQHSGFHDAENHCQQQSHQPLHYFNSSVTYGYLATYEIFFICFNTARWEILLLTWVRNFVTLVRENWRKLEWSYYKFLSCSLRSLFKLDLLNYKSVYKHVILGIKYFKRSPEPFGPGVQILRVSKCSVTDPL